MIPTSSNPRRVWVWIDSSETDPQVLIEHRRTETEILQDWWHDWHFRMSRRLKVIIFPSQMAADAAVLAWVDLNDAFLLEDDGA